MSNSHCFQIGDFSCAVLNDGEYLYSAEQYFPSPPRDVVERELAEAGTAPEQIPSPYTCLFVDTGDARVLVDTGAGPLTPDLGRLPDGLRDVGVEPPEVDVVVITHAHPDHIGGLTSDGRPAYPNARHVIMRDEWSYWTDDAVLGALPELFASSVRENLVPLEDRFELLDGSTELVPGIELLPAPGHTVGHCAVAVTSAGEELLHVVDVAMHPLHLAHPDWPTAFDHDAAQALRSRRLLFDHAADEGSLVLAYHFHPFPSLGRVSHATPGWAWQPAAGELPH
jgi:glyoxylase-like metal-dependent hydrolase (beta-lactamase superfamily II)